MGRQIIKQPNGKFCIFSSIVDNFTHYDMSEKEIVELWANKEKENIAKIVKENIKKLERGEKPYYQFTKTFEESLYIIEQVHGKEEMQNIKKLFSNQAPRAKKNKDGKY